jgi:hypothetical protein
VDKSRWITPCADSACGKVFHPDRRAAEGHRVARELWDQATGRSREGYQHVVYRCKRCCGFHLGRRKIVPKPAPFDSFGLMSEPEPSWSEASMEIEQSTDRVDPHQGRWADGERGSAPPGVRPTGAHRYGTTTESV